MKPRLTTLAIAALALAGGAVAQIEPLTCAGPGATRDCRITMQPIDALAASYEAPRDPIGTAAHLLEQNQPEEARSQLMLALTTTAPERHADLYFLLGLTEARLGAHRAAANAFVSVRPATFASRYNEALARAQAGDHATAQRALAGLLTDTLEARQGIASLNELPEGEDLTPTALEAISLILTASATLHYMNETPTDAITTLQQLLKVTPITPELKHLRMTAIIELFPSDAAIHHAQALASGDKRDLLLGRTYTKAGMNDYAQQHYRAAAQQAMSTQDANALTEIAVYHTTQNQWSQAASIATEALKYDPTNHTARTIVALELENQGKPTEAANEHRQALKHGSDPASTNARLALALDAAGDPHATIAAAETALKAAGAHPLTSANETSMNDETQYALLLLLAKAHHALSETPEALAYADAATRNPLATSAAHAYAGDLAMTQNNPSAALTHYAQANQEDPHIARSTYHAHLQLEQYPQAREAASNLKQEAGETLHLIAWTYALEGDTRAAHQTWRRAAQTDYEPAKQILERINQP